jgi:hypothetical protein
LFQKRQNEARTRARLFRQEVGETMDHAVKAAGHAAVGMRAAGTRMAPATSRVRDAAAQRWEATVAAFNDTTGMSADDVRAMKRAHKQQRAQLPMMTKPRKRQKGRSGRRLPRMMGLLAAGMAAGAATAMVLRRRRQQWEEYDASEALEAVGAAGPAPGMEPGAGAEAGAGTPAEGGPLGEAAPERTETMEAQTEVYGTEEPGGESVDDLVSRARRSSRNTRG